jgi:aspartyl-tRNA(Asn)/glutamyl-tRNA(Gln) amidotransferase subunit B
MAELVRLIDTGTINGKIAKSVADEMVLHPHLSPASIVEQNPDFKPLDDTAAIEALIDQVLSDNATAATDYKAGKAKAFAFLIGQAMKLSRGKASPELVNSILLKKLQ